MAALVATSEIVVVVNSVTSGTPARRATLHGRDYLVAPATLIVPDVLDGSDGPILYTEEEFSRDPAGWNGTPIVVRHPLVNGVRVSARSPEILESSGIGHAFHSSYAGKLASELWFDVERTRKVDVRILDRLQKGEKLELSTGLFVGKEPAPAGAVYNSPTGPRPYTHIARNHRPDHIAILPDEVGACAIAQGCGVFNASGASYPGVFNSVNGSSSSTVPTLTTEDRGLLRRLLDLVGITANAGSAIVTPADSYGLVTNPYPNEHAARVADPSSFRKDTFRRKQVAPGVSIIMAKKPDSDTMEVQAYRFSASKFTPAEARAWLRKHKVKAKLEKATGKGKDEKTDNSSSSSPNGQPTANVQLSHSQLREQLAELIDERFGPDQQDMAGSMATYAPDGMYYRYGPSSGSEMCYIRDVFDKYVVYERGGKTWKIGYSTDLRTGEISLSADSPVEVRKVSSYKPVVANEGTSESAADVVRNEDGSVVEIEEITYEEIPPMDRKATISFLVANCDCWKGAEAELDKMSDERLAKLKAGVDTAQQREAVANAARKGFTDPGGNEFTWNEATLKWEKKEKPAPASTNNSSLGTSLASASSVGVSPPPVPTTDNSAQRLTAEEREDLAFARAEKVRQKQGYVDVLTANVLDAVQKKVQADWLIQKPLEELRNLASLLPPTMQTGYGTGGVPVPPLVNYGGASVPSYAPAPAQPALGDADLLPMPVFNWEEESRRGSTSGGSRKQA